jgi:Cytochrome C'
VIGACPHHLSRERPDTCRRRIQLSERQCATSLLTRNDSSKPWSLQTTIGRSVDALSQISETEIASWQVDAQPEYRKEAMQFVSSVQALHEAAATKDLDAVLTGYTDLVSSCTRCHTHVRRMRTVSFEP